MTTVAELIEQLKDLPATMPVHVWTREEEFGDLEVYVDEAEATSGGKGDVCKVRGS